MTGVQRYFALIFTFLLGIHEGCVALWQLPEKEPIAVFPYQARMLPEEDRKALEGGIYIEDEQSLHRLLEDYLS